MKKIFKKLYKLKNLSFSESYKLFKNIYNNNINDAEIISAIVLMKSKKETLYEILGAVKSILKRKKNFYKPKYLFSDITGTGGDYKNSINISTISAIVAASVGFKIAKHCNYNITGKFGSANFLKKNKININISSEESRKNLDNTNICFLLAPLYYDGFKYVKNIRKSLKIRTIFNLIAPLLNPSRPPLSVIGVYSLRLLSIITKICKVLKYKRVISVHSNNYDEITLYGPTYISELYKGKIKKYKIYPESFGFKTYSEKKNIKNKNCTKNIVEGIGDSVYLETISANASIILKTFGEEDIKYNASYILKLIKRGMIKKFINKISNGKNNE
ncbi:anthranilate phosphoribosyltransferase [Buchnera aphidicola (Pseudoregma panicola)]|uniref:anthranilate phosphoribosyltransferase n=1 Tax=Buchnera aphidicola TaxID=9 RepID=UPI0031B6FBB7